MGKVGRPKAIVPKDQAIKARVSEETKQRLEYLVDKLELSQSDIFRGLVDGAYEHLCLVDQVKIATWSPEEHQAFLRGHIFQLWRLGYHYGEAAVRLGLTNEWTKISGEYMKIVQEVNEHGRPLPPEKARPAAAGGSQPGEGTVCTLETLDSDKEGQTNEMEKT